MQESYQESYQVSWYQEVNQISCKFLWSWSCMYLNCIILSDLASCFACVLTWYKYDLDMIQVGSFRWLHAWSWHDTSMIILDMSQVESWHDLSRPGGYNAYSDMILMTWSNLNLANPEGLIWCGIDPHTWSWRFDDDQLMARIQSCKNDVTCTRIFLQ